MRIAISGAGIAGPSLAHWLHHSGHEATLIEKAPRFRTDGYVIDFLGRGLYDWKEWASCWRCWRLAIRSCLKLPFGYGCEIN